MGILDIIIILFILFGVALGFKRGFTHELIKAVGFILAVIISYFLKNPVSTFLYEKLPFFKFGIVKNIELINIIFYEVVAFIICLIILLALLKIIITASTLFEKFLDATIILGIPSKIAGAVVGLLYNYVIAFFALYILNCFFADNSYLTNSKFREPILNNTPLLSSLIDESVKVVDEFNNLKNKYNDSSISEDEFNYQAVDLFLKYKVVKPSTLEKLIENKKISSFNNCLELINKYKENNNGN